MNASRICPLLLLLTLCWVALPRSVHGQQLRVLGGNQLLSVTTGIPGGEPTPVTNSVSSLRYRRQAAIARITVQALCPGQRFTLKVVAVNPTAGIAAPEVTLIDAMPAANFITNIPAGGGPNQTCTLQYTASATFAQGNSIDLGADVYNVIYTLVAP